MKLLKKAQGFTLIELLIVMAIFSMLVMGLVVAVNPVENLRKASDSVVINDVSALSRGAEAYGTSHNGFYPATLEDLISSDEVRIDDDPPEGYAPYQYIALPSGCISGVSCTSITIVSAVKGFKYSSNPFVKFESATGKICFVSNPSNSCL